MSTVMSTSIPTVKLNKELTIAMSVTDRARSKNWYRTHLGFEELFSIEEAGWTELSTPIPGVTIGLGDSDEVSAGNCVPVFGIDDINKTRAALEAEAVKFDGDTMTIDGMVSLATFYDPDGNALMLSEDLRTDK